MTSDVIRDMAADPVATFTNKALAVDERLAAATMVGELLAREMPLGDAWRAVCSVVADEDDHVDVRKAAVRAMANAPGPARNKLTARFFEDPGRAIRKEALAVLRSLPFSTREEAAVEEVIAAIGRDHRGMHLVNLAIRFGYHRRIVETYREALAEAGEAVRSRAIEGLAMLGEMDEVRAALADPSARVRTDAACFLGMYGTDERDVEAVRGVLEDADVEVRKAAETALKRQGVLPVPTPAPRRRSEERVDRFGWMSLLEDWSLRALQDEDYAATLPDAVVRSGWLGHPGATEAQLQALERRLGRQLPPSYAEFLRVTNGFRCIGWFIDEMLPAERVRPFAEDNAEWIAIDEEYATPVSAEEHLVYGDAQDSFVYDGSFLATAIQVSEVGDGVILLNPEVVTPDGEWEAWFFASWLPGASRYRSFVELIRYKTREPD